MCINMSHLRSSQGDDYRSPGTGSDCAGHHRTQLLGEKLGGEALKRRAISTPVSSLEIDYMDGRVDVEASSKNLSVPMFDDVSMSGSRRPVF